MRELVGRSLSGRCLVGMLLVLALVHPPLYAATSKPAGNVVPIEMTMQNGKFTARIVSAPLRRVMEELSSLSGAQLLWMRQEEEQVSVEFKNLSLAEAIERILKKNFMLTYSPGGGGRKLVQIWMLSRAEREAPALTTQSGTAEKTPQTVEQTHKKIVQQGRRILTRNDPDTFNQTDSQQTPSLQAAEAERVALQAKTDPLPRQLVSHLAQNDTGLQTTEIASYMTEEIRSEGDGAAIGSMMLDSTGSVHIGYRNNGSLKYARKLTSGGWTTETVESGTEVGSLSVVLESSGLPQISYYDLTNGHLKYARKSASGNWSIEIVD
jgi:hypothetical protein